MGGLHGCTLESLISLLQPHHRGVRGRASLEFTCSWARCLRTDKATVEQLTAAALIGGKAMLHRKRASASGGGHLLLASRGEGCSPGWQGATLGSGSFAQPGPKTLESHMISSDEFDPIHGRYIGVLGEFLVIVTVSLLVRSHA